MGQFLDVSFTPGLQPGGLHAVLEVGTVSTVFRAYWRDEAVETAINREAMPITGLKPQCE